MKMKCKLFFFRSYLCKYSHNTIQESKMLFIATEDRYNGLTIEDTEKSTEIEFNAKLDCK